ncbi:MAG: DUF805 domain-containing protein [Candidatus Levyibacteriota bacterium]
MRGLNKFLTTGINRRQYLLLFLLGLPLSLIVFAAFLYLGLFLSGAEYITYNLAPVFPLIGFVLIAIYYFVLKIKRLHDMGHTSDSMLFTDTFVPGGFFLLGLFLFGVKTKKGTTKKDRTHAKYLQSMKQKFAVFLIFFILNFIFLYLTGRNQNLDIWLNIFKQGVFSGTFWFGVATLIYTYLFYPYLVSYFFRLGYIRLKSENF